MNSFLYHSSGLSRVCPIKCLFSISCQKLTAILNKHVVATSPQLLGGGGDQILHSGAAQHQRQFYSSVRLLDSRKGMGRHLGLLVRCYYSGGGTLGQGLGVEVGGAGAGRGPGVL